MTNKISTNKHGFTIIEVVLVLAIAGLIFLMVFVALPSLQRGQRDTQRKNDMARISTALTNYQSNNGSLPKSTDFTTLGGTYSVATNGQFAKKYLGSKDEAKDPDGSEYDIVFESLASGTKSLSTMDHKVYIEIGGSCNGESAKGSSSTNKFAILYKLEGAGVSCTDNN